MRHRPVYLIALLLLSLPLLFSCSAEPTDEISPTLEPLEITTAEETETEAPDVTEEDAGNYTPVSLIAIKYTLIYGNSAPKKVQSEAEELVRKIAQAARKAPKLSTDLQVADSSGKEVLIGETDRAESIEAAKSLNYMDYTIRISEKNIVVLGGSPLATVQAVRVFSELLLDGKIESLSSEFVYDYDYDRFFVNSLAYHADTFVPKWADDFTPPAWMLDYEEKLYAMTCQSGRITSTSHRGDVQNYPENSLEAILSAIMLGADAVEIDIRLTKDNVMVLMHDETLTRTTDWSKKAGKNGLPSSPRIADWTYEQLRELRLLYRGKPTHSRIPTAYEAVLLLRGRAQIHFDRKDLALIDRDTDVYLLAEETGTKDGFLFAFGFATMRKWQSFNNTDTEFREFIKKMTIYLAQNGHSIRTAKFQLLAKYGDHPSGWKATWNDGYKTVFTDKIEDFCRFSAAKQKPIPIP